MALFTSIVCGIDFSDHSAQALRCAAALAERSGATLHIVSVVDPLLPASAAIAYDVNALKADITSELHEFVAAACADCASVHAAPAHIPVGRPPRELLRLAENVRADLIVLGTQGLGAVRRVIFGSTTHRVLRDAGMPVLAVPLRTPPDPHPFAHRTAIIVGVDVERGASRHVDAAASLAVDLQAPMVLVHGIKPAQVPDRWRRHADGVKGVRVDHARAVLERLAANVQGVDMKIAIEDGDPVDVLVTVAQREGAQLVVIGLGDPETITSTPGATAYRVVCESDLPVLAVPEAGVPRAV